ncbi:MAG: hypothetical protein ACXW1Z_14825 [Methylobacter sp.]
MKLNARVTKLETKNRPIGPALIVLNDGETQEQALQRCYPNEKSEVIIYLDEWDLDA